VDTSQEDLKPCMPQVVVPLEVVLLEVVLLVVVMVAVVVVMEVDFIIFAHFPHYRC